MTYREFLEWCNKRACDGCWSLHTALFCMSVIREVKEQKIWRREKKWRELEKEYSIIELVVTPINEKMKEMYS